MGLAMGQSGRVVSLRWVGSECVEVVQEQMTDSCKSHYRDHLFAPKQTANEARI